ncbi:MAG: hypothetical protein U0807_06755 [Candidatus Binatia bacterium]
MRGLRALLAAVVLAGVPAVFADEKPGGLVVIVHPARTGTLGADDVARIYLGRRRFWDDGAAIVALNLPAGTPVRERFSRRVLRDDSAHLADYWNAQYFHGVLPPAVLSSSDAVKRYVAADRKAIGYIEAGDVDETVRVVLTLE